MASFTLLQWKKAAAEKQKQVALSEAEAKEAIVGLASRIALPPDFELNTIKLDKKDGFWVGNWKRKYRGYPFEKDSISIRIREGDDEFFSY